jgi:hypothetical protein
VQRQWFQRCRPRNTRTDTEMASDRILTPTATHYLWLAHALLVLSIYGSLIPFWYQSMPLDRALTRFQGLHYFDPSLSSTSAHILRITQREQERGAAGSGSAAGVFQRAPGSRGLQKPIPPTANALRP